MMRIIIAMLLLPLWYSSSMGQSRYAVSSISPDLKARASSVIRNMEMHIDIKDLENVSYTVKNAVTVLNKNGDDEARILIWYNKTRNIKSIKATIYDEFGLPVSKIAEKDFEDMSAASDYSLFEDSRMKMFQPAITDYPYTLEYEYEIRSRQSLILPDWTPNSSSGVSLENAVLTVACSPDFNLRYKEVNYPGNAMIGFNKNNQKTYTWEIKNLKAFRDEPYSPDVEEFLPSVKLAPSKFIYSGVGGTFTTWHEYGKWMYDHLLKGRDDIPQQTTAAVLEITKGIQDPKLKAKRIYEYVQQKIRYVSVQIGIGGYQPIPATEVDRLSYGDCKALVNYTRGLLRVAGIDSYYAVVEAGSAKKSAIPDFASMNQFNHAILCIPFPNDTTWIDCTSKTLPFGFLGDFTDDRLAVACTDQGGKLIRTPKLFTEENRQIRRASFSINEQGDLSGEMETAFEGWQYDNREILMDEPRAEQLKKIPEIYSLNNLEILDFKLEQVKSRKPVTSESIKFVARSYMVKSNDRFYLILNPVNKGRQLKELRSRTNPVYINRGYIDEDEIVYTIPKGFHVDTSPPPLTIETPFASFSMDVEVKDGKLLYTRKIKLNEGRYPPDSYQELVKFYQKVAEADDYKVSLIR